MSSVNFIYTDKPLKKLEYSIKDVIGEDLSPFITFDKPLVTEVRFEEKLSKEDEDATGHIFPDLKKYRIITNTVSFQYSKNFPLEWKTSELKSLEWLLNLARDHLKTGAKKFYYAHLWYTFNPDCKKPKMKKIDLAKFKPNEKEFEFGRYSIWEFVDTDINF